MGAVGDRATRSFAPVKKFPAPVSSPLLGL